MTTSTRRAFLTGTAATVGLGVLGACSGGKGLPSESGGGAGGAGGGKVELQFMANHIAEDGKLLQKVIDEFSAKNAGITVKLLNIAQGEQYYTKLKTAAVGHQLPDVFFARTYDTASNAAKKWQLSLGDYVKRDADEVDVADFWPAEVAQMSYQDQLYSLPYDFSNHAVYYNKTMFEKDGVPVPTEDWTWDDFFDIAAHFPQKSGKRQTRWGAAFSFNNWFFMGVLRANGGDTFSADLRRCVLNSEQNVETFRRFYAQMKAGVAPLPNATPAGVNPFGAGMVALNVGGSWDTQFFRDTIKGRFEWDVVKLPKGSTGERAVSTAGGAWGISAESKHPDEAWEFLKFLTAEPQQNLLISELTRSIPGRQSASKRWEEVARTTKEPPASIDVFPSQMADDAVNWSYPAYWAEFETAWNNRTAAIANGEDPAKTLASLEGEVNKAADRYA